jgi:O-antigen biosynthesis protein WbqP
VIYPTFGKRAFDIFFSLAALLILSPLLLIVALLIKVFDSGPVIFRQRRIGRHGEPFIFYKFRSMPVNTGDIPSDKIRDIEIGRVGRFIRRTSMDELPQLFNILRGDMSIVGPRPSIASQRELIEARRSNGALLCRPGLTGLTQIRSFDGMTVSQKAESDAAYARSITLFGDVKIILGTFSYLLKPPPVY